MAGLSTYLEKAILDWALGGASATQPVGRWVGLASGSPNVNGASEGPWLRATATYAAANSAQGSATNLNDLNCTATAIGTAVGWNMFDASQAGNRLAFGTVTSSMACASADIGRLAAGNLKIVLT